MISSLSRTNPEHTEQLSLTDMFTQASAAMLEQGVDPKDLDPAIAVLAMFNNKTVLNAAQQVSVAGTIRESLTDQLPTEQDEQLIKTARHISGVQYELGRPARRRNVVRGLAIAGITGGGLLTLIGSAKDDIRESLGHNDAVVAEGNRIMDNNTLVYDPSILKGDAGKDIPVVGPILGAIPGGFPTTEA